jgi:PAS domain S-box-containing protein
MADHAPQAAGPKFEPFYEALSATSLGVVFADFDGRLVFANGAICSMLGFSEEEMCGKSWTELSPPEDAGREQTLLAQLQVGSTYHFHLDKRCFRRDGSLFVAHWSVWSLGSRAFPLVVAMITDQGQADLVRREIEEHFRYLADTVPVMIWTSDVDGRFSYNNKRWLEFTGRSREETTGGGWVEAIHPDDRQRAMETYERAFDRREPFQTEYRLRRHDGEYRWVLSSGAPRFNPDGSFAGYIGSVIDIGELKHATATLRESEERFRSLYENSTLGLYRTTPEGKILLANPSLVKMLGFSSFSELAQRNLEKEGFEPGYERAEFQHRLASKGEVRGLEATWTRNDGTVIFVRESAKAIRDAEGKIAYYEGTIEDITERKRAEEALRQSEEKFFKAFRGSPVVMTLSRVKDRRFIDVNDTFERLFGYRREEAIGSTPSDLGLWDDPLQIEEFRERLLSERDHRSVEARFRTKNGSVVTCLVSSDLIEIGKELCILSVVADITKRKEAEEALSGMSRKLIEAQEEERARIARELHDDINQRLAMLALNLEDLKDRLPASAAKLSKEIGKARKDVMDLGADIRALSHGLHTFTLDHFGLAAAARGFCKELSDRQSVEIECHIGHLPNELPRETSLCLFRVLQEAVQNAVKHSGSPRVRVSLRGGSSGVELTVHDSGIGFEPEEAVKGNGLGLISMKERLKAVNGELLIDSQLRRGTTIYARVPFIQKTKSASSDV